MSLKYHFFSDFNGDGMVRLEVSLIFSGRGEPHIQFPKDKEELVGREMWWFEFPFGDLLAFSPHFCSCSLTSWLLSHSTNRGRCRDAANARKDEASFSALFGGESEGAHNPSFRGAFTGPSWTISVPPRVHSHSTQLAHPLQPFSTRLRTCSEEEQWGLDSGQSAHSMLCFCPDIRTWFPGGLL